MLLPISTQAPNTDYTREGDVSPPVGRAPVSELPFGDRRTITCSQGDYLFFVKRFRYGPFASTHVKLLASSLLPEPFQRVRIWDRGKAAECDQFGHRLHEQQ